MYRIYVANNADVKILIILQRKVGRFYMPYNMRWYYYSNHVQFTSCSDFDSDELEQLAGSADDDSDDEEPDDDNDDVEEVDEPREEEEDSDVPDKEDVVKDFAFSSDEDEDWEWHFRLQCLSDWSCLT